MSYERALEAAGAKVLEFRAFGDWSGTWWAKVILNGKESWISGSFGSCSGCDAFEAEFGFEDHYCEKHLFSDDDEAEVANCEECNKMQALFKEKLAAFGKYYLDNCQFTQEEAEKTVKEDLEWDMELQEMYDWIKENALK
jgi:hypothetical protein